MVSATLVGSVTMLLAGMGLLFLYLRRYEGHFDQPRLFFALLVGLFVGIFLRLMEQSLFGFESFQVIQCGGQCPEGTVITTSTLVYSFAYTAMGYALLESLGKTAVLGLKKFRSRPDAPFHGAALGVGFGAMWCSWFVARFLDSTPEGQLVSSDLSLYYDVLVVLTGASLLVVNVVAGVWIGRGIAQGSIWRGLMVGTLWQVPALALYWSFVNVRPLALLWTLLVLAYCILTAAVADRKVLQTAIPPEIRDQIRRQERRERRKAS